MKTLKQKWGTLAGLALLAGLGFVIVCACVSASGQPAPVLAIAQTGSNQFSITVTNGDTNVNYEVWWTPSLNDAAYPWQLLAEGNPAQTNFNFNVGTWPLGFFRANIGSDFDGDGILNWLDGDPNNAGVGALTVIINSPANGAVVQ